MRAIRLANIAALIALGAVRERDILAVLTRTGTATAAILRACPSTQTGT